ncbi:hypothetical protein JD844_013920 [Phrynosoma platyrhinos]|uniref:KIX domain-containing protein n=1 Tax=Phrynosoma platyrhinos TaxID=52577 RepID=A0ABQ7TLW9_PHRPL|nr:hypothetical protein JD844_013920 [Phrynosoma platyrhinos]
MREKLEGRRETLVSASVREVGRRKGQVTVGRTPLGACLRQLREAQEEWEAAAAGSPEGAQSSLLDLLEQCLALIDRIELLRERKSQRKKEKKAQRLVAARQDGSGGNNKILPPRRGEGLTGGSLEEQHQPLHPSVAPEEEGREASGPWKSKVVVANGQLGGEGEDQDHGDDESDEGSGDGQVLNYSEGGLALIDKMKLLSERKSERKKKKPPRTTRLVAAEQDGSGGNSKTVPPRQSECLVGSPQEEKQQPQHPSLAPEKTCPQEEGREASDPRKSQADQHPDDEQEDQDCGNDEGDKESGDASTHREGSECSDRDDYDEDKDRSARCDALWAKMDKLEQMVDKIQDPSQEKVDALKEKLDCLKYAFFEMKSERSNVLEKKMICLWSALWDNLLQALTALQKAFNRFLPEEMPPFKKESNSLRSFLQVNRNSDTVEKLSDFQGWVNSLQSTLQNYPLLKVGLSCGVQLKEMDAIKRGMGILYSATLLHVLLKQGQEKVDTLQEKVDALKNISLQQVGILKMKIGAVQKQMGALWKVPLKKMMVLPVMVNELSSVLLFGSSKEVNALKKKACDQIFTLKVHLLDAPQNEVDSLWQKLVALEDVLCDIPIKKLEVLAEREKVLRGKVDSLQDNLWNSLEAELKFLRKKLDFLWDAPHRELDELQEVLDELRDYPVYPPQESVGALQNKMGALQKKMGVLGKKMSTLGKKMSKLQKKVSTLEKLSAVQKAGDPLEDEKVMEVDRTGFSEIWNAQDTGTKQMNVAAGKIRDQPPSVVAEMAIVSSLGATKWVCNLYRSSNNVYNDLCISSFGSVKTISPDNDSVAARRKLMAYANQIEEDMYKLANSKTEYHQLVMEKLHAIHKKLDQNLNSPLPRQSITGNDQSALQASWTQPHAVPPVTEQVQPSHSPLSAVRKRSSLGVETAENLALQIPEPSTLSGCKRQNPQQPEEATCAESSEDTLANYTETVTETGSSEPPQKKQKMDTVGRIEVAPFAQELYAAHQKYVKYVTVTINQNMEKVGDLMSRLQEAPHQASALKTTEDAKGLTSILKKALALLKCYLEDS